MNGETLTTIVGIFLAAILIFIFPMMSIADRNDDIAQLSVQTAVADFVNNVRKTKVITGDALDKLDAKLVATNISYDRLIEVKKQDENPSKKYESVDDNKNGENIYYIETTSQIEEEINTNGKYLLNSGDIITVVVYNTSPTMAQMIKNFFYSLSGNNASSIVVSQSGMAV